MIWESMETSVIGKRCENVSDVNHLNGTYKPCSLSYSSQVTLLHPVKSNTVKGATVTASTAALRKTAMGNVSTSCTATVTMVTRCGSGAGTRRSAETTPAGTTLTPLGWCCSSVMAARGIRSGSTGRMELSITPTLGNISVSLSS